MALPPHVPMATTDMLRMHARLTVITVQAGSRAGCSSAQALGIAAIGAVAGVGVVAGVAAITARVGVMDAAGVTGAVGAADMDMATAGAADMATIAAAGVVVRTAVESKVEAASAAVAPFTAPVAAGSMEAAVVDVANAA